ncbi:MAG: PDZ domain-containing protein [Actinobacteria bacterium]|nr:PDZ domain-containing protein [Actinomycetota bacterium]
MSIPTAPPAPPADSAPPIPPPPTRRRRWLAALTVAFVGALVVVIAGTLIRVPYVISSPGAATPVRDVVRIEGTKTYRHRGEVLFLTVSVSSKRPNLWRFVWASNDPDAEVISEDDYLQGQSPKNVERQSVVQMDESQLLAKKVALEELGYRVTVTGAGARVVQVMPDSPADGVLRRGDVITAIDGVPVRLREQVGEIVRAQPVGTIFSLTLVRKGQTVTTAITTEEATSGELRGKPHVGISAVTEDLDVEFPVDVQIDPGPVSGPSAGLAFTLTIIDELSPGDLTGGKSVAVTGTIDAEGNVGEVGGVRQKTAAAKDAGATLMLVPRSEVGLALPAAGDMEVVGVRTLEDVLRVLRRHGGAPVRAIAPAA